MYLTGFGDPTNGNGGYSFIKLPLKTSRYEKDQKKETEDKKKNMVTGTDSDLRKLPISYVKKILLDNGYSQEYLNKLQRWDKISLLKHISNKKKMEEEDLSDEND